MPFGVLGLLLLLCGNAHAGSEGRERLFPVEMGGLMKSLTDSSVPSEGGGFPRVVTYAFTEWNMMDDTLEKTVREVRIKNRPTRIIPHSVGLAEILWAIAPRLSIVALHRSCLDPDYSFIAHSIPKSIRVYESEDAEVVIGLQPDLILTTYYSSDEFKNRLRLSSVPFVEIGFFGNISSIEEQIGLLGKIIGEEEGARRLVETMELNIAAIQDFVRSRGGGKKLRVLFYDHQGFVAGESSTFDSLCNILGVENVASEKGIRFFKQIDYETVLQWNPDVIIVPEESHLEREISEQEILKTAKAVRMGKIKTIPNAYLMASSQFVVASLNYLAGTLYED